MTEEERLRAVETRLTVFETSLKNALYGLGILGAILAGAIGLTYAQIPNEVASALKEDTATTARNEIDALRAEAEQHAAVMAKIAQDGKSLTIGGVCFKPRNLVRCFNGDLKDKNNVTWLDNADTCTSLGWDVEHSELILAQCTR